MIVARYAHAKIYYYWHVSFEQNHRPVLGHLEDSLKNPILALLQVRCE